MYCFWKRGGPSSPRAALPPGVFDTICHVVLTINNPPVQIQALSVWSSEGLDLFAQVLKAREQQVSVSMC